MDIFKEIKEENEISQKAHEEFEQKNLDTLENQFKKEDKPIETQLKVEMMQLNSLVHFEPTIRCN